MFKKFNSLAFFAILLMFANSCTTEDTSNSNTVTDIDGNVYTTVKIGTQVWMVENLKTTKYRNGESIGTTTPATKDISQESTPKYQWAYNGNEGNVSKYGRLYTGYAVSDSRNIAPTGWHIPADTEWTILEENVAANLGTSGSVAKSLASTTDWVSSTDAGVIGNDLTKNNNSGFTGFPGGYRQDNGPFTTIGGDGYWWSSTESTSNVLWYRHLEYNSSDVGSSYSGYKKYGFSVRCLMDYDALPAIRTSGVSAITVSTATCGGNLTAVGGGGAAITARGVCWATTENPTITNSKTSDGIGSGAFTSAITGLTPETTYYVRAYATNSVGTTYGTQKSFSTKSPMLTTMDISTITSTTATCGGNVTSIGGADVTARGVCWSKNTNPTITNNKTTDGNGIGTFSSSISSLAPNTTYYVRAFATNSVGTAYGSEVNFTTPNTMTDNDGNVYNSAIIGTQIWTIENLKTTKYNDGTAIPFVTAATTWDRSTGAYCDYNNDIANGAKYGHLYNWYSVNTGKLAPIGWHVPSYNEWTTLINSGSFSQLPFLTLYGGLRWWNGEFNYLETYGYWWSSTVYNTINAWYGSSFMDWEIDYHDKSNGYSVRCVRDY